MIVAWLWHVLATVLTALLNLMPHMDRPVWWTTVTGYLDGLSSISAFYYFVPLQAIGFAAAWLAVTSAIAIAIFTGRLVVSHATGGGGSTA